MIILAAVCQTETAMMKKLDFPFYQFLLRQQLCWLDRLTQVLAVYSLQCLSDLEKTAAYRLSVQLRTNNTSLKGALFNIIQKRKGRIIVCPLLHLA